MVPPQRPRHTRRDRRDVDRVATARSSAAADLPRGLGVHRRRRPRDTRRGSWCGDRSPASARSALHDPSRRERASARRAWREELQDASCWPSGSSAVRPSRAAGAPARGGDVRFDQRAPLVARSTPGPACLALRGGGRGRGRSGCRRAGPRRRRGGDDEKFALVRLGVPAAVAGAACGTLLLGLRRLEVVDAGTGAASGRSVGLILGAIVVAATSATLVGAISSPEGAVLVGGVLLIFVGGRPLVSVVSNRLVEAGLIHDGVLPARTGRAFQRGESSGLLRPEVGRGYHFLHETFVGISPRGPGAVAGRPGDTAGSRFGRNRTVDLRLGHGGADRDRSGAGPIRPAAGPAVHRWARASGGDRLVLDSGEVIDVSGAVPRYSDEQAPGDLLDEWRHGAGGRRRRARRAGGDRDQRPVGVIDARAPGHRGRLPRTGMSSPLRASRKGRRPGCSTPREPTGNRSR